MTRRSGLFPGLVTCVAMAAGTAHAESYALLVGAGKFPLIAKTQEHPHGMDLEGPRPDTEQLRNLLIQKFRYKAQNVIELLDEQATRKAILAGVDSLISRTKAGDRVLIYYSGHGTSSYDPGTQGFGMDPATGAIVPADIDPQGDILAQLIVGKRDLRPRLLQLETKATVLVIFDSCFSGESVKSVVVNQSGVSRFVSLAELTKNRINSETIQKAEKQPATRGMQDYPYKRVVYYSAASNAETAQDIPSVLLQQLNGKFTTVDGGPHGAYTNALLKVLAAQDVGSKGICLSLFQSVQAALADQITVTHMPAQHPQMLAPDAARVGDSCFTPDPGVGQSPPPPPPPAPPSPVSDIRRTLDAIAAAGGKNLRCDTTKRDYAAGDETVLQCTAPDHGYVTMVSYGQGDSSAVVMWPNRYESGEVGKGEFKIPGSASVHIRNYLPRGMNEQDQVMLVLFDTRPVDVRKLGVPEDIFTGLSPTGVRAFRSQLLQTYDAAEIVFRLHK